MALVVFFQTTEYGIDIRLVQLLAALYAYFFAELFVVSSAESTYSIAIDADKLTAGVIVIENIICWILLIFANAVDTFNYVDSIFVSIEQCIYI